ncbi:MAG: hypothetical protein HXY46_07075 [Syntrophaceae bacterium]|nr:hypothetical protein [Syntrophaceae bacterium]
MSVEGMESPEKERKRKKLICPKCQVVYETGKYCDQCGSLLVKRTEFREIDHRPVEKGLVKRWSKEWLRLSEEKANLENCLSRLEAQREKVSSDIFQLTQVRYQDQIKSISSLRQKIGTHLEAARRRASEEIDQLERELTPMQKRLEEVQSLYQSGAMTKADFSKMKNEMKKEMGSKQRGLKKYRQILSLLPSQMGGKMSSPWSARDLLRPLPLMIAAGILIVAMGGYLVWQKGPQPSSAISQKIDTPPPSSPASQPAVTESQERERIRALFENIRQANLKKDIDLFMSCYSLDYPERKAKRAATLETWKDFDYLDLSYELKNQKISTHIASVRVEWRVRISQKSGGKTQESKAALDVQLKKEGGHWKIKETQPVS